MTDILNYYLPQLPTVTTIIWAETNCQPKPLSIFTNFVHDAAAARWTIWHKNRAKGGIWQFRIFKKSALICLFQVSKALILAFFRILGLRSRYKLLSKLTSQPQKICQSVMALNKSPWPHVLKLDFLELGHFDAASFNKYQCPRFRPIIWGTGLQCCRVLQPRY